MTAGRPPRDRYGKYRPTVEEVNVLVRQAASHPLGTRFLANGSIDAVAATFGVHAFVVDEARSRMRSEGWTSGPETVPS